MSNNQLAIYNGDGFDVMVRAAGAMAKSGFFQDSRDVSQAMVKVMAGAELGIAPFAAMSGIAIIKGKPSLGASLMAGIVKNDHRYDYRVIKHDDTVCSIQFYELGHDGAWEESGMSTFTAKDAQRAGTQNMSKFPKNMLFARAMSNGFKWYCAGAGGGMPVYSDGELDAPQIVNTQVPRQIDTETGVIDGDFDEPDFIIEDAPPFVPESFDEPEPEAARNESDTVAFLNQEATGADWKSAPHTDGQLPPTQKGLRTIVGGKGDDAKLFLKIVYGVDSSTELTKGQCSALLKWMGATQENSYTQSPIAMKEARSILTGETAQAMASA